jgi:hypothetical protein
MHNFAIRYLAILAFVCFLSVHELSAQSKLPSNGRGKGGSGLGNSTQGWRIKDTKVTYNFGSFVSMSV